MTVSTDLSSHVREIQGRSVRPELESDDQSTIQPIADRLIRTDHSTTRGPGRPKSPISFHEYVGWLESKDLSANSDLESTNFNERATDLDGVGSVTAELGQTHETIDDGENDGSILVPNQGDAFPVQTMVIDTIGASEFYQSIRIDSKHTAPDTSVLPAPHILVDEVMADLGRSFDECDIEDLLPVAVEVTSIAKSPHANWEVPDFRWPSSIEAVTAQKPKLANLLLNQSTRFIRPGRSRLVVAGNGRNQGTSFLAIGIARWAAKAGQRVLLVDADLANPELGSHLGIDADSEISWLLTVANREPVADSVIQSESTGVCFLPLRTERKPQWGSVALLDMLGTLVSSIQDEFDLVVIDAGSANQLMNSLTQSSLLVDSALLVQNGGNVDSPLFHKTCTRMNDFGIEKIVVAENFSNVDSTASA